MDSANQTKNLLGEAVEASGRKKQWLAAQLNVSRVTLHRWCTGQWPVPTERQPEIIGLLFPELPEGDRDAKQRELFPEGAIVSE